MILRRTRDVIKTSNISYIVIQTTYIKYSSWPAAFSTRKFIVCPQNPYNANMHYLEVLVADATFHGVKALTYSSGTLLQRGALVTVPLRSKQVLGIVCGSVPKPAFTAKPIGSGPYAAQVPTQLLQLFDWLRGYYPAPLGVLTQMVLPKQLPKKPLPVASMPPVPPADLPTLSADQQAALNAIQPEGLHVLHGETGTGKT